MVTANMDFHAGSNGDYVKHLCSDADIICLQEAKDFALADLLPAGWKALQDTSSEAKAGCAIGVDTGTVKVDSWKITKGCDAPPDKGMLARYILSAQVRWEDGGVFTPVSAHEPPQRYSELQPAYTNKVKDVCNSNPDPVIGADANMDIDTFANKLGSQYQAVGKGIIGIVSKSPLTNVTIDNYAMNTGSSDHPAVAASKG